MLTDEPTVRQALRRMVSRMEENPHMREDLLQEALFHLWLEERQHPGQRLSWYLQGVKFHLQHLRTSGRSLDSAKHRGARAAFADSHKGQDQRLDSLDFDEGIMSEVNAHDLFALLAERLKPLDRTILGWLASGFGTGEIANRLHLSRQAVSQHRRNIAAVAIKLGVVPQKAKPSAPGKKRLQNPGATSGLR